VPPVGPDDQPARIRSRGATSGLPVEGGDEVALLGDGKPLTFRREPDALVVDLPDAGPSPFGLALRITLSRPEPQYRRGWLHT